MSRLAYGLDPAVNSFRLPEQVHTEHTPRQTEAALVCGPFRLASRYPRGGAALRCRLLTGSDNAGRRGRGG